MICLNCGIEKTTLQNKKIEKISSKAVKDSIMMLVFESAFIDINEKNKNHFLLKQKVNFKRGTEKYNHAVLDEAIDCFHHDWHESKKFTLQEKKNIFQFNIWKITGYTERDLFLVNEVGNELRHGFLIGLFESKKDYLVEKHIKDYDFLENLYFGEDLSLGVI
jgi:hypothetical protein